MLGGRVEEWQIPYVQLGSGFLNQEMSPRLPGVKYSVVPWSVFAIYSTFAVIPGMWHSSTCPSNIQVVIACDQFYWAFPYVSTASVKYWGQKVWERG